MSRGCRGRGGHGGGEGGHGGGEEGGGPTQHSSRRGHLDGRDHHLYRQPLLGALHTGGGGGGVRVKGVYSIQVGRGGEALHSFHIVGIPADVGRGGFGVRRGGLLPRLLPAPLITRIPPPPPLSPRWRRMWSTLASTSRASRQQ